MERVLFPLILDILHLPLRTSWSMTSRAHRPVTYRNLLLAYPVRMPGTIVNRPRSIHLCLHLDGVATKWIASTIDRKDHERENPLARSSSIELDLSFVRIECFFSRELSFIYFPLLCWWKHESHRQRIDDSCLVEISSCLFSFSFLVRCIYQNENVLFSLVII